MALTTTALPAARAAPPLRLRELMPPFQVEMAATTPIGLGQGVVERLLGEDGDDLPFDLVGVAGVVLEVVSSPPGQPRRRGDWDTGFEA